MILSDRTIREQRAAGSQDAEGLAPDRQHLGREDVRDRVDDEVEALLGEPVEGVAPVE